MLDSDPIDVALDEDGDLLVDPDVGFVILTGIEGVKQCVQIRLLLFKGEWFLDLDAGVPYYQEILGEKYNESLLRQRLAEAIKGAPGVLEILSLELEFVALTRRVNVIWSIRTTFGDTEPDTLALGGS